MLHLQISIYYTPLKTKFLYLQLKNQATLVFLLFIDHLINAINNKIIYFYNKDEWKKDFPLFISPDKYNREEKKELALSDALLTVPLNPEHSSLNLSQAVLLIAYEFQKLFSHKDFKGAEEHFNIRASKEKEATFLTFINDVLTEKGYYPSNEKHEKMQINLNNIFLKAELSDQDINTLYGVFKHLKKQAEQVFAVAVLYLHIRQLLEHF